MVLPQGRKKKSAMSLVFSLLTKFEVCLSSYSCHILGLRCPQELLAVELITICGSASELHADSWYLLKF